MRYSRAKSSPTRIDTTPTNPYYLPSGMRQTVLHYVVGYGLAVASVAAALFITQSLQPTVFPTPLFFTAIVASTWYGGTGTGLFATLLATGVLQYFYVAFQHPDGARPLDLRCISRSSRCPPC